MTSKPMNIVVVGGSLASLFTSIILKRLGHNITILERSPTSLLQTQGAGIVAGGYTQDFFKQYDRTHTPIAVISKVRQYLDRQGNVIDRDAREQRMTSWDLLYNVLRANLDGGGSRDYCPLPNKDRTDAAEGHAKYEVDRIVLGVEVGKENGVEVKYRQHGDDQPVESVMADMVIAADGASSHVRDKYAPVERKYAGYVAWRGTVNEAVLADKHPSAAETFIEKFTFFHSHGTQILSYVIPGPKGTLKKGDRLVNWVWYCNYAQDSDEWRDLMTDVNGKLNTTTLHAGKMRPEVWQQQKEHARQVLPPQFADLVCETKEPFVQAITDSLSEKNIFADGKVVAVGDAVAGFRPHTAASTTQAAYHALLLEKVFNDEMSWDEWQDEVINYATNMQRSGVEMGDRSQFGKHPFSSDDVAKT